MISLLLETLLAVFSAISIASPDRAFDTVVFWIMIDGVAFSDSLLLRTIVWEGFCGHVTFTIILPRLFGQTPSGFRVHLAKGYLAPHHAMAAFHGEDVVLPLPMVATSRRTTALIDCAAEISGKLTWQMLANPSFSRGNSSCT